MPNDNLQSEIRKAQIKSANYKLLVTKTIHSNDKFQTTLTSKGPKPPWVPPFAWVPLPQRGRAGPQGGLGRQPHWHEHPGLSITSGSAASAARAGFTAPQVSKTASFVGNW